MTAFKEQGEAPDPLVEEIREIVGDQNVLSEPDELLVYECDGLPQHKHPPRAVVFPTSTEEISEVLKLLSIRGVSFAPRGAGTGLSGGALAVNRGVVIELARMRRILRIEPANRLAVVQTGLVNLQLSKAVAPYGLYYVPDPSSQPSCTIGGNIAENAGGIHCLKYGTTTDHILGARVVLADGTIVDLGGAGAERPGFDLLGAFVGSEGTFGIATEATVKLSMIPPAVRTLLADFTDVNEGSRAVSAIIAAGMLPAALEMLDNAIIRAIEASVFKAGLPIDAEAVLLVELDGVAAGIDEEAERAADLLKKHGARTVHLASDENERKKLWAARKGAFGAVGRLSPDIMIQDAVVPRSRLPEVLAETYRIGAEYKLQIANVFHAGDGNLHPLICFDVRAGDVERVREAGREIMKVCVAAGGSITGEHGVGLDKSGYLPLIFSDDDMDVMLRVRAAYDPSGLCNPGKIVPMPRGCGEARAVATVELDEDAPKAVTPSFEPPAQAVPAQRSAREAAAPAPTDERGRKQALIAAKLNEARILLELRRLAGTANVSKLSGGSFGESTQSAFDSNRTLVVTPSTIAEATQVIQFAGSEGLAIVPAGSGTWIDVGNRLAAADIILSTRRMTRIINHEPADLVITAEAGTTMSALQAQLGRAGQWLPIDPPDDGTATVGGVVATGLGGAHSAGFGLPRSFVIGMRVLLADGRLIKAGGNVVKNVAGYDLCKLFTGSYGSLGLIVDVTFKLRPLPAETRTVIAGGSMEALVECARAVIADGLFPVALELVSPRLASQLKLNESERRHTLLIRIAGSAQAVVSQAARTLALVRKQKPQFATLTDEDAAVWEGLAATAMNSGKLMWRAGVLPADLVDFLGEVVQLESDEASHPSLMWHAGLADGRVRAIAQPAVYHREAVRTLERLRRRAEDLKGCLVVESASSEVSSEVDAWGSFGSAAELMRRVKAQLDPKGMLSPGRFAAEV